MKARGWRKIAAATWGHPNDPQIYGDLEVDAGRLLAFVDDARLASGVKVTVTHLVGKGLARALGENLELNTLLHRGKFEQRRSVDIFFVVSVADGKDLSGVKVQGADGKSVVEIAEELGRRAARIRTGDDADLGAGKGLVDRTPTRLLGYVLRFGTWLTTDKGVDLKRWGMPRQAFGSAMVSSVGMFGIQHAYGPLSPLYRIPILALVGEVTMKAVVVDGEIVARPILTVSATMDHRYLDGAQAARLGRSVRGYLEDPAAYEPPFAVATDASAMSADQVISAARPWLEFYGDVPATLDYPEITVYEAVARTVRRTPDAVAYDFLGSTGTYRELGEAIDRCANALAALGLDAGDRITISLPTSRQGVVAFYATAKLGAVASLIHPLSTAAEIETYLNISSSRFALTLDAFYDRFAEIRSRTQLETLILTRIPDGLPLTVRAGFWLTRGRKIPRVPSDADVHWWSTLMAQDHPVAPAAQVGARDLAAILYSGGTTGTPKGIMLSHLNFVAEAMELSAWVGLNERDTVLAVLPIFHGFGLAALIHAPLQCGARAVLVPVFSAETVAKLIRTKRPTLMAGVPTLYDTLASDPSLQQADLSCLRAAFSGADTLPVPVKERFEQLVASRGGQVKLLEGYGLTEAVTAIMATPLHVYREGSVGVPFPDILAKICRAGSDEELPPDTEGEICISGPAVMMGYLDEPEATAATLKQHADGRTWLHTGDIGKMDEDGFFAFTSRLKRMIKSSGFNVYPAQVEAVLYEHPAVADACVIGVPDESQGERVQAVVVLRDPEREGDELAAELIALCRERLIKWSCPRSVVFRATLPKTRLGKIDFVELTRQESERASVSVPDRAPAA